MSLRVLAVWMLTPDWLSPHFISFFSLYLRSSKLMEPRLSFTPLGHFNFAEFCRSGRLTHQKDFSPPVNRRHFPAQLNFRMQRWWLINTLHCRVISRIVRGKKATDGGRGWVAETDCEGQRRSLMMIKIIGLAIAALPANSYESPTQLSQLVCSLVSVWV